MNDAKTVFIFGAGFSKPAGMPLATDLVQLLKERLEPGPDPGQGMGEWLEGLRERLGWLLGDANGADSFRLNIEQVFHYAHFDIEVFRLKQHLARVGRGNGPGTPWNQGESIESWLTELEEALRDEIVEAEEKADMMPIMRWAEIVGEQDSILTFNYDTLVERALEGRRRVWNHVIGPDCDRGVPVFKLHGSIDWIIAHRHESFSGLTLLFDKPNEKRRNKDTGFIEEDYRLWQFNSRGQLAKWVSGRDLQKGLAWRTIGIGGLGAYKPLHRIPGLGGVWVRGMRALYEANLAVIVGFSMSDFDVMAQMQFAQVARARTQEGRPLRVHVIDPCLTSDAKQRFRRVFKKVKFEKCTHEEFDWSSLQHKAKKR